MGTPEGMAPPEIQEMLEPKIEYEILGDVQQALNVRLKKGDRVFSDTNSFLAMDPSIKMTARMRDTGQAIMRSLGGETFFQNEYLAEADNAEVLLNSKTAGGKIIPLEFGKDKPDVYYRRGALVCAEEGIKSSVKFPKNLFTGLFGGQGLLLGKLTGEGKAHLVSDGDLTVKVLGEENDPKETIVDQGYIVAFEDGVDFDIYRIRGGLRNWLFSGEGVFATKLSGKGKVWIQHRNRKLENQYGRNMDLSPIVQTVSTGY